ncbi:methyltransferase domain-containing protein [Streptomyces sp. 184]|uniref:methyltransferase domain-containing protein n=1 Tax=Streptomyces sp. 184 TaxID=1827526 RepID=UPI0038921470
MTVEEHPSRAGWGELGRVLSKTRALGEGWVAAFGAVDRAAFLPPVVWVDDPVAGVLRVDRRVEPARWYRYVDANCAVATRRGALPGPLSVPSVVMGMLRDLDVRPGMRVLHVGTGSGWVAGLLAHRLGSDRVVTVDIDGRVADAARRRLHAAGLRPTVLHGDGTRGDPSGAPFDRVISTYGLPSIPGAWVEQVRPGGVILALWETPFSGQRAPVKLVVESEGKSAGGDFLRSLEFMRARGSYGPRSGHAEYVPASSPASVRRSLTRLTAEDLTGCGPYPAQCFVLGLVVPAVTHTARRLADGSVTARFSSLRRDRSWATVTWAFDGGPGAVCQHGERSLWDEVQEALHWWESEERPSADCFGLTVHIDGTHTVWLDEPHHTLPPVP